MVSNQEDAVTITTRELPGSVALLSWLPSPQGALSWVKEDDGLAGWSQPGAHPKRAPASRLTEKRSPKTRRNDYVPVARSMLNPGGW
jgi:hypothetical protein